MLQIYNNRLYNVEFSFVKVCIRFFGGPYILYNNTWPVPVAARSKAWVCGRSLAGIRVMPTGAEITLSCDVR